MQVHSRVKIGFGLLFRYLFARCRAAWWWSWSLCTMFLMAGTFGSGDPVQPRAVAIVVGLVIVVSGLFSASCWLITLLICAAVLRVIGPVWEYTIGEDTLSMSGGAVGFVFRWSDLRTFRTHRFGWRLWFGTRLSWFGIRGMQVLLPRIALSDDEAELIDALLEGQEAHRAGRSGGRSVPGHLEPDLDGT